MTQMTVKQVICLFNLLTSMKGNVMLDLKSLIVGVLFGIALVFITGASDYNSSKQYRVPTIDKTKMYTNKVVSEQATVKGRISGVAIVGVRIHPHLPNGAGT